jgi:hypothetical protein
MIDYNNSNRINIDDFIKLITDNKMPLTINEIQILFHSYEIYNNSLFYYEEMFKDLKNIYYSQERALIIDDVYNKMIKRKGSFLIINDFKVLFNPYNHPLHLEDDVDVELIAKDFFDFIESFQFCEVIFI